MTTIKRLNNKPVYKLVDGQGRLQLPKAFRDAGDMQPGDIVKLELINGKITTERVRIVEMGDRSPAAVEAYVRAAIRDMPRDVQFDLAACLMEMVSQSEERVGHSREY